MGGQNIFCNFDNYKNSFLVAILMKAFKTNI